MVFLSKFIDFRRLYEYNILVTLYSDEDMNMEYMTIKEAAEKWGLSVRRVQAICNEGKVEEDQIRQLQILSMNN